MRATLDAALGYAARGWAVLPLRPGTKLPATAHGLSDASIDPTVICRWWSQWPAANVGIRTGAGSGLVVLDVDPPEGFDSLARLEARLGPLPLGPRVTTPRGGLHVYFAHPGGLVPNSAGKLGVGLDVRGDGGYIVAPPSTLPGVRRYLAITGGELPPCPLAAVLEPPARRAVPARQLTVLPGGRYAQSALVGELQKVRQAPQGQRNHELNRAAFRLGQLIASGVLDDGVAARALLAAALEVGLGEQESRRTILSGLNGGASQPRQGVSA